MCALDSTESCLYEAAERHEPINPHLLSVSPPLTCTTLLRPRNFDDLRLETDLSRLLSSPFLDPTVDFHRVLPWIPWGGSIVLLTSLLHLLPPPVCFYLREDVPANFIPQRSLYQWMHVRLPFIRIAASSVIEGWSHLDDGEIRWEDGGILEGFCNILSDVGAIETFIWRFDLGFFFFNLWNHLDVYAKFECIKIFFFWFTNIFNINDYL